MRSFAAIPDWWRIGFACSVVCFLWLTAASAAPAASEQSLGQNLGYLRFHALPGDLPSAPPVRTAALVLDLRYTSAAEPAARAFAVWLKNTARPDTPVLVLINGGTAPALLALLASSSLPAGTMTIGPATKGLSPDIAMDVPESADRAAYDAFEHGTPLEDLVATKIDKNRFDEASVAKDRAAAAHSAASAPAQPATAEGVEKPAIDPILQRALQLHRGLVALKKAMPGS